MPVSCTSFFGMVHDIEQWVALASFMQNKLMTIWSRKWFFSEELLYFEMIFWLYTLKGWGGGWEETSIEIVFLFLCIFVPSPEISYRKGQFPELDSHLSIHFVLCVHLIWMVKNKLISIALYTVKWLLNKTIIKFLEICTWIAVHSWWWQEKEHIQSHLNIIYFCEWPLHCTWNETLISFV